MQRLVVSLLLVCGPFATACEDDSSQPNARDRAVQAACDRFKTCGAIRASGGTYTSEENCRVEQSSSWEGQWPPGQCDGKIVSAQLDLCINAIEVAVCGETLDILNIVFNKCPKSKVCAGASE